MNVRSWRKYSTPNGDNCIEVGALDDGSGVAVRNSRRPDGAVVICDWEEWNLFLAGVARNTFSRTALTGHSL